MPSALPTLRAHPTDSAIEHARGSLPVLHVDRSSWNGTSTPLLVLGLGNRICGDDGLGIEAVARLLEAWEAPEGVRILDGGTLGLSLLPELELARRAILVDAIRGGRARERELAIAELRKRLA